MQERSVTLPSRIIVAIGVLCVLPYALMLLGVRFAAAGEAHGLAVHTLLEWTAFCVALISVHFSFVQFSLRGDASTPIIGIAMFCSGMLDAFNTLAVNGLMHATADMQEFVPFTWSLSRIVNAVLIVGGASLFLRRPATGRISTRQPGTRFVGMIGVLFGLVAYVIVHACAVAPTLPQAIFPNNPLPRPWDAIPLVIFLIGGGIVLPRFHRAHPSLFSHGLLVSLIPHIAAQCYAAFWSRSMFDGAANIASCLKILAYQTPFYGLMLDYRRAYQAESSLQAANEKLRIAREVQQGLLPANAPELPGYDMAGISTPADVMGGDYFDYVPLSGGCWGLVVADVSGHDVGASALLAQTRAYLRAVLREHDEPGRLLTEANRFVANEVRDTRFVTVFFARLNPERRQMQYAGAGHNAWLLEKGDAQREFPPTGPAIGMIPGIKIPSGGETVLPAGSLLVIATDGIVEAESLGGVPFGVDRLLNTVRANRDRPACEIVESVIRAVYEHTGEARPHDDLTVVVLKATAPPA